MTARDPRPLLVTGAAALAALVLGVLVAARVELGAGVAIAALLFAVALHSPALAVALWVPSFFLSFLPGGNQLLQVGFLIAAVAVVAAQMRHTPSRVQRPMLAAMLLLAAWCALSVLWARSPEAAVSELWKAGLAMAVTLAVVWVCAQERDVVWVIAALAGGAVVSALIGFLGGETVSEYAAGGLVSDRLAGGAGDANQLAASLVPAVALLLGLSVAARGRVSRMLAVAAIVVAGVGIAATQSRGGLISAAVMVVLALVLLPRVRGRTLALAGGAALAAAVYFSANPAALERVTSVDDEGTGRSDLWRIGWRMVEDHPLGVGLDNFRQVSADYALSSGGIERINQIVDTPIVAHNTFLQVLAELGVVGLVLYLLVVAASAAASLRAARAFSAAGRPQLALLSRASLVALLGFMTSSFFVSFAFSYRMWALLALGPALLTVSSASARPSAHAPATR